MDLWQLRLLQSVEITYEQRVDIRKVIVATSLCESERAKLYVERMKNPYSFKYGEIAVNVKFSSKGKILRESLSEYLSVQKRNI